MSEKIIAWIAIILLSVLISPFFIRAAVYFAGGYIDYWKETIEQLFPKK